MKILNEALRMFLAISALILTAMLSTPSEEPTLATKTQLVSRSAASNTNPAGPNIVKKRKTSRRAS